MQHDHSYLPTTDQVQTAVGTLPRRQMLSLLAGLAVCSWPGAWASAARDPARRRAAEPESFLAAVQAGDVAVVETLLEAQPELARATDPQGRSAFVLAHLHGHPTVAALLLKRGLELDVVEAVLAADWPRVEALAAADPALINTAHPIGGGPLHASALGGGEDQYRLRALGSDSNGRPAGGNGFTPARAAMDCRDPIGAWLAATDILSNGGHVNAPQAGGDSVLHGAVRARDLRLVRLVLRKGGDVGAQNDAGQTPTQLAEALEWQAGLSLLRNHPSVARDCRDSRLAFNASREPFRLDPLEGVPRAVRNAITGVSHANAARVKELLRQNPLLIHAVSTDAELAIEACGHTGQREIIQLHLDLGAPLSLPTAISLGNLEHARWLLQGNPRLVNERGPHDFPIMWYPAIGQGSVAAAELLLEHGADLEQESGGETALHWAAQHNQPELIRYLLEKGANPAALSYRQDRAGITPLQLATARGKNAAVGAIKARLQRQ